MSLKSLIATGTKLWLDSIDPEFVRRNRALGATGATSNPIIVSDILKSGSQDDAMTSLMDQGHDDDAALAWAMTDKLVSDAQAVFRPVWDQTRGNDGYVSFELDPLLEDLQLAPKSIPERTRRYVELGKKWSAGHKNRMIKVPATPAGLAALEELAANGITLNVTLIFSERQYKIARDNVWRGAQRRKNGTAAFKSVYSIFVSRVDVYTDKYVTTLSPAAQGQVGIVNAKRLWQLNQQFWKDKNLPLQQEIIFASTGAKKPTDAADKYVDALAGSDIQTNPPATNDAVEKLNKTYTRKVDQMPPKAVLDEIDAKVDQQKMENKLMEEGAAKFADPHKALLKLIGEKRSHLAAAK
ncbi:MAG TPA: transaldolase family protein [Tepidisphaeraceae bacterium]|jgi:transaldolase|nr:transaldolase family protein [Tepidisphaeraceae bacterium]